MVAAFLGGFSERFIKVMLHGAEGAMGAGSGTVKAQGSGQGEPPASRMDPGSDGAS